MARNVEKPEMSEEQEVLMYALQGAAQGISAAVEQETINATQVSCLLNVLLDHFQETFK